MTSNYPSDAYFLAIRAELVKEFRRTIRTGAKLRKVDQSWSSEFRNRARNIARDFLGFDVAEQRGMFEDAEAYEGSVLASLTGR